MKNKPKDEWITPEERMRLACLGRELEELEERKESLAVEARAIIGFETPVAGIDDEWWFSLLEDCGMVEDAFVEYAIKSRKRFRAEELQAELAELNKDLLA
jgi:hypothetical protein